MQVGAMAQTAKSLIRVVQIRTKRVDRLDSSYACVAIEVSPAQGGKPLWQSDAVDVADGLCIIDSWARLPVT